MQNKLLDTKELSEYLGIAVSTILEYRMQRRGPVYIKLDHLVERLSAMADIEQESG